MTNGAYGPIRVDYYSELTNQKPGNKLNEASLFYRYRNCQDMGMEVMDVMDISVNILYYWQRCYGEIQENLDLRKI